MAGAAWFVTLVLLTRVSAGSAVECGGEVDTFSGTVRGHQAEDGDYCSFLGIPYAEAPTGDKRFKAPTPVEPWDGVLEANTPRKCTQPGAGDEDCLALNVFVPSTVNQLLPVLVYIHGGVFLGLSAVTKGLGPLLSHDIIVVSMNYRLGVLGFLCLGTEEAPGNAGFRDQLLALQWVQDNIVFFGGDPNRVSLAGTSSGATLVHLLTMSPLATGLFQSAICLDGTAAADFSVMEHPIGNAKFFATVLGFESDNSDNLSELAEFYQKVSVDKIKEQGLKFALLPDGETTFSGCVERPGSGLPAPVISEDPVSTLHLNRLPVLFTYSNDEGSMSASKLKSHISRYNDNFPAVMPASMDFPSDEVKYREANRTKYFYFGNKTINEDTAVQFTNFWGDRQFVYPAVFSAREHAKAGIDVHLIEFTYTGKLSKSKDAPQAPGACHADIENYLMPKKPIEDDSDRRVVDELSSIVANFVKYGTANASTSWPAASADPKLLAGLHIGKKIAPFTKEMPSRMVFWDELYRKYRRVYQPVSNE